MLKRNIYILIIVLLNISIASCSVLSPITGETALPAAQSPTREASIAAVIVDNSTRTYPIVDTGQGKCYDNTAEMTCSQSSFTGQDAQFTGNIPSYTLSADGLTVHDNVTGLNWQRSPDTNSDGALTASDKLTLAQAEALPVKLNAVNFGGYSDWRLPTIKELYSLIDFRGTDPSAESGRATLIPFIDIAYFQFAYGDSAAGERTIDSQYASSTMYTHQNEDGDKLFGVNFADGRIKGYDLIMPGGREKTFFVICVRGNDQYGLNALVDNGDQTITDAATGLMWAQGDSGIELNWEEALAWVEAQNAANYLRYSDWRLPDIKELQSIIDYSRSPDTTNSAAMDPLFECTQITNEIGEKDYPFYWSSTTHASSSGGGEAAGYIAFGRALGYMNNFWTDVHGAGAQRSDPKTGNISRFSQGRGPQGDVIRIQNYVRLVRGGNITATPNGNPTSTRPGMSVEATAINMNQLGGLADQGASQPRTPPQVAISVCSGLSQGTACQFSSPNGMVSGACQQVEQQLVCAPSIQPAEPTVGESVLLTVPGEYNFSEGPAADRNGNVYFSDINADTIYKWTPDGSVTVFLSELNGPNGLAFDENGNLVACEGGNGRLISIDPQGQITVLADQYNGIRFNEPNDLWIDPQGGIYFTDPAYQFPVVQDGEHVYYLSPDRSRVIRAISDMIRPNGIVGTQEGKTLYVADYGARQVFAYDINRDGSLSNKRLFADTGSDGMTLDNKGNLYLTTSNQVQIYDASGTQLEDLSLPEDPTNVTFVDANDQTLFITAKTAVYVIQVSSMPGDYAASNTSDFTLNSPNVTEGGMLPVEYTCDGAANTLPLSWSGAPAGTKYFAVIMQHEASPTDIHWYWVVYNIPADVNAFPKNMTGIGTLGTNSVNDLTEYAPPCSKGPGPKTYTYTVYALSAEPQLSVPTSQVTRAVLLDAIREITLASAELNVTYSRQEGD